MLLSRGAVRAHLYDLLRDDADGETMPQAESETPSAAEIVPGIIAGLSAILEKDDRP